MVFVILKWYVCGTNDSVCHIGVQWCTTTIYSSIPQGWTIKLSCFPFAPKKKKKRHKDWDVCFHIACEHCEFSNHVQSKRQTVKA